MRRVKKVGRLQGDAICPLGAHHFTRYHMIRKYDSRPVPKRSSQGGLLQGLQYCSTYSSKGQSFSRILSARVTVSLGQLLVKSGLRGIGPGKLRDNLAEKDVTQTEATVVIGIDGEHRCLRL